jgi:hypothetical protein
VRRGVWALPHQVLPPEPGVQARHAAQQGAEPLLLAVCPPHQGALVAQAARALTAAISTGCVLPAVQAVCCQQYKRRRCCKLPARAVRAPSAFRLLRRMRHTSCEWASGTSTAGCASTAALAVRLQTWQYKQGLLAWQCKGCWPGSTRAAGLAVQGLLAWQYKGCWPGSTRAAGLAVQRLLAWQYKGCWPGSTRAAGRAVQASCRPGSTANHSSCPSLNSSWQRP